MVDNGLLLHVKGITDGSSPIPIRVESISCGSRLGPQPGPADRVTLTIQRITARNGGSSNQLHWTFVYDPRDPLQPPDVILPESDDPDAADTPLAHFADIQRVTSLSREGKGAWDPTDSHALLRVVVELVSMLRQRHTEVALGLLDDRLSSDLSALGANPSRPISDIAVESERGSLPRVTIAFAVPLDALAQRGDAPETATVTVSLTPGNPRDPADVRVSLPAKATRLTGNRPLKVPLLAFDGRVGACQCFSELLAKCAEAIRASAAQVATRQQLVSALSVAFGSLIETDSPLCQNSWFMVEDVPDETKASITPTLIKVTLPDGFPVEPYTIAMFSGAYNKRGAPLTMPMTEVPYSPRWPPEEMAARIVAFVREKTRSFVSACDRTPGATR